MEKQDKKLVYTTFLQREENVYHHTYDEELLQYEFIRNGDLRSVEESKRLFRNGINGKLSNDQLRHKKYLFVACITFVTRFCIEGGMKEEITYNMSELYIQQADTCDNVTSVDELHTAMVIDFTQKMAEINQKPEFSKPVKKCMDYIYYHLHSQIKLNDIAKYVSLAPTYLAFLFKKEMGITVREYIRFRRIDAAKNMLRYSDYTVTEIGDT